MSKTSSSVSVSELARDPAGVLKNVRDSRVPFVLTEEGKAAAFLVSVEAYERAERERELLILLAKGEKQILAGETHDADDVLREIDSLLKEEGA
jgi:prevent-host-death family protein